MPIGTDAAAVVSEPGQALQCMELRDIPSQFATAVERAATALAVFNNAAIDTDALLRFVGDRIAASRPQKQTFVPIFVTNYCHSECKMCGMRAGNRQLHRKFSTKSKIEEQLHILRDAEQVRAVGFLTGEYEDEFSRSANAFMIGWAIARAFELGFERVYFNIGSLTASEVEVLADWLAPYCALPITMCVFQETYDRQSYARFMGATDSTIPKADFDRRIRSYENWLDAGFRYVNPGFLVGLHKIEQDMVSLITHVDHLAQRGAEVTISLPRLRPALGVSNRSLVPDDRYLRLIATVALVCPESLIVLTTREDQEFQDRALPVVGTISPGSPDVSPYRWHEAAANDPASSQFVIPDLRRPRDILGRIVARGYDVKYFRPRNVTPHAEHAQIA